MKFNKNTTLVISALSLLVLISFMVFSSKRVAVLQKDTNFEKEIQTMKSQSNSTSVDDIEKDLNETDLNHLDKEITNIETELDQGY